jgi:chromate reductase
MLRDTLPERGQALQQGTPAMVNGAHADRLVVREIPGSLRRGSYNRALLEAARQIAPASIDLQIFDLRGVLLYDGDVEAIGDPEAVRELKRHIAQADVLLIATPEYNGAMPGVLKNALDWASRPPERVLRGKPVALMGATPGRSGTVRAQHSARRVFEAVGAHVLPEPTVAVTRAAERFDADGNWIDEQARQEIRALLDAIVAWVPRVRAAP